jgi:hypothetical protein
LRTHCAKPDAIEDCRRGRNYGVIVSWNFYFARPGNEGAVLQQRIRASDVRRRLGLPRGRIISKIEGSAHWPDVAWRLDFPDMPAQDADMKIRANSPEFEAIRTGMRQLYRRFERPLYAPCNNAGTLPVMAKPQQQILVYGLYCEESACPAIRAALHGMPAVEFMSGGTDVPRFILETGEDGLASDLQTQLGRLATRLEYSLCHVATQGD